MKLLLSAPPKRMTSKRHNRYPEFEGISKTLKERKQTKWIADWDLKVVTFVGFGMAKVIND